MFSIAEKMAFNRIYNKWNIVVVISKALVVGLNEWFVDCEKII